MGGRRTGRDAQQNNRDSSIERSRAGAYLVADIGDIPPIKDPKRREAGLADLHTFLVEYFPHSTGLTPFSPDHRELFIPRMETTCESGGRIGNAMYRGSCKTTGAENTTIWAGMKGTRKFAALFGADAGASERIMDSIKRELATNDFLLEDFPEVCWPIRCLEGKYQRCASQSYQGNLTYIEWTADTIVLPWIPGSEASGFIVSAHAIESASRGLKYKTAKGENRRPDLVILDDFQTDRSAESETMTRKRLEIITKNIFRQGGHRNSQAVIINATPIKPDDAIEQMQDRKRFPTIRWTKMPMMKAKATHHDDFWLGEYKTTRHTFNPDDEDDYARAMKASNELYAAKREYADEGCIVSWDTCFDPENEISAIQHAYNILIDEGDDVFASECQMETRTADGEAAILTASGIQSKAIGIDRNLCPVWVDKLTAFVDVQEEALYWVLCGWGAGFSGHVVDYGVYPDQPDHGFSYRKLRRKMSDITPDVAVEPRIRAGLDATLTAMLALKVKREDEAELQINQIAVDSGDNTDTVYEAIRRCGDTARVIPSKGRTVAVTGTQWEQFPDRPGEEINRQYRWLKAPTRGSVNIRVCQFETNWWKTFVYRRLATPKAGAGCVTLFGDARDHAEFALHMTSETRHVIQHKARKVDEWKLKPGRDNHLFDAMVGCAMLASVIGTRLDAIVTPIKVKPQRVSFSDMQRARK